MYGTIRHMVALPLFHSKFVYSDGAIREMVLWKLPKPTCDYAHGFKYRLHYGYPGGPTEVRYDNERGKGDHRHIGNREEPYQFIDVETLVRDFLSDIDFVRGGRV
jgi:hypothetical protein